MVLPLMISIYFSEFRATIAFCVAILVAVIPGLLIRYKSKSSLPEGNFKLRDSYFIVATAWIIAAFIGCIPYIISGSIPTFMDAIFETVSGFTTTGSTIVSDIEAMPKSILFWRSLTQWLGGMGIIVLFVALIPDFGIKARSLAGVEAPGPTITKLSARFSGTAQMLYSAYIILTFALFILLMIGGMSMFDAINHAFTCMATGGFSTKNASIAAFDSPFIYWVLTIFMFLAGTNFNLFFVAIFESVKRAFSDEEFRVYIKYVIISIALISMCLFVHNVYPTAFETITQSAFQVITIVTTTGYATANYGLWPGFCQLLFLILMLTGACSSSTSGGIKIVRVLLFGKIVKREIKLRIHDNIVDDIKLNRKKVGGETLAFLMSFITLYIITLFFGTFIITLTDSGSILTNFTAVLTCLSNVGPGLGGVDPAHTFAFYSPFAKGLLSFVMVAGRLELTALFLLFTPYFWNPNRA